MSSPRQLQQIWIKKAHRGPMDSKEQARLIVGKGLVDNANQGGKRQVTILSSEAWQAAAKQLGRSVDPSARRANLVVSGVDLEDSRGKILEIGTAAILIHGETRPCERMDEACKGLRSALAPNWRGGVYGTVLRDSEIRVGDPVVWKSLDSS